jgi:invasion protein IalB
MGGSWKIILALFVVASIVPLDAGTRANELEVWYYQCMEDEESSEKICTTEIATSSGDRDFIVYFVHNKVGGSPLVVAGDEQNFSSLIIRVDDKDAIEADQCDVGWCYFEAEKSGKLLKQFRKGRRARVSILDDRLDTILDTEITLRGFTASYAKGP